MIQSIKASPKRPTQPGYYWIRDQRVKEAGRLDWELAHWNGTSLTIFTPDHQLQPYWTVVFDPDLEYWITRPLDEHYTECLLVDWIAIDSPGGYPARDKETRHNGHLD